MWFFDLKLNSYFIVLRGGQPTINSWTNDKMWNVFCYRWSVKSFLMQVEFLFALVKKGRMARSWLRTVRRFQWIPVSRFCRFWLIPVSRFPRWQSFSSILMKIFSHLQVSADARKIGRGEIIFAKFYLDKFASQTRFDKWTLDEGRLQKFFVW